MLSQEDLLNESATLLPSREELSVIQGASAYASYDCNWQAVDCYQQTQYCPPQDYSPQYCEPQYQQSSNYWYDQPQNNYNDKWCD